MVENLHITADILRITAENLPTMAAGNPRIMVGNHRTTAGAGNHRITAEGNRPTMVVAVVVVNLQVEAVVVVNLQAVEVEENHLAGTAGVVVDLPVVAGNTNRSRSNGR
jgi:hypothetical protein